MTTETESKLEEGTAGRGPSQVAARVTHGRGRYLIDSENRVFVSDSASRPEGAVAPGPTEFLLSALAVCALGSVERHAGEQNITVGAGTVATVRSERNEEKKTQFKIVHIEVFVDGVTQEQAEDFVYQYTQSCPIYNTTRRGGPVAVEVVTESGRRVIADNSADWDED